MSQQPSQHVEHAELRQLQVQTREGAALDGLKAVRAASERVRMPAIRLPPSTSSTMNVCQFPAGKPRGDHVCALRCLHPEQLQTATALTHSPRAGNDDCSM